MWAELKNIETEVIRPDWSIGKHAGFARNTDIVLSSDEVVAFWDGESRGTKDTIRKASDADKLLAVFICQN